ncbi:VWA domain-containing protein [Chloroflexales bacterium ZM16-3]|nr:VWA domain-containing protein [Chloroflexales bacterium ZM16-3]
MSTSPRHSLRRLVTRRRRGQSIPIIALMIVVLVAMVGLSVDVGNTFSEERKAVSASNAAALAGMEAYINRANDATDQSILDSINASLESNGIKTTGDGSVEVSAYYLNSQGELLPGHPTISSGPAPTGVSYIQVKLNGKVDTSFARVVGRNDLPINASSHAGLCPVNSSVYPIGVDTATITGDSFNDDGTNGPDEYKDLGSGMIQRRIFVKTGAPGGFSWLRWMEDKGVNGKSALSAEELAASMSGVGNIAAGFEEAPWPTGPDSEPTGYPDKPGELSPGDWVWGTTGWKGGNAKSEASVGAAINEFIFHSTYLILPIYSDIRGNGSNTQVRVVRLGTFVITGQGDIPSIGPYFDMVFLGDPVRQYTACEVTPPPPADNNLELFGDVSFYPEYAIRPTSQQPIQYVVVLDSSGSMSANFNGECDNKKFDNHKPVQCANGPADYPDVEVDGTGVNYWWKTESERRIYVAKQALMRLVRLSNMSGNADYDNTRPPDKMAVVWFREYVPESQTMGFSSTPNSLITYIQNINDGNGDYRSEGGTNGAAGLYRASLIYKNASKTVKFNGKDVEYKRVVLFITDGVSNQFLDTGASNLLAEKSAYGTYKKNSYCYNLDALVVENAGCQTTDVGGTSIGSNSYGMDRPITQMITTSQNYLRNTAVGAEVFVIALSNIASTGLRDGVPSSTNYFFSAEKLEVSVDANGNKTTNVDGIIDKINAKVELGSCVAGPSGSLSGAVTTAEFGSNPNGFVYPQVGEVIISNQTDSFTAPIIADTDGTLSYVFSSVPPGTYQMEAYIWYHHPDDLPGVMRLYSRIWSAGQAVSDFIVDVNPSTQGTSFSQRVEQPLTLKLTGDVCAS